MKRATDARPINDLLNLPAIRPHMGPGDEPADVTDLIADKRNICLFDQRGGCIFIWRGPRIYEGHAFFIAKGRDALTAGREALSMIDADMVWASVATANRKAAWFLRQLGFRHTDTMDVPGMGPSLLFEMRF